MRLLSHRARDFGYVDLCSERRNFDRRCPTWHLDFGTMFGLLKQGRRRRLRAQPFPKEWLVTIQRSALFFRRLPASDQAELLGRIQVVLAEKRFEGCGGLAITDEIRVTIAAQAFLFFLHRQSDYFSA